MARKHVPFIGLVLAGLLFVTLALWPQAPKQEVQNATVEGVQTDAVTPTPTQTVQLTTTSIPARKPVATATPTITTTPTPTSSSTSNSQQDSSGSTQGASSTQQTNRVAVSINGASSFSVDVPSGANQCDVLTKARDEGKINQLLMKYSESFNSYGVYQINGIGKENSVWWVYKVNGQSPPLGCSHIKANNGDSVEWEYIGPQ